MNMRVILDIERRDSADARPYRQRIPFETNDTGETLATALQKINASLNWKDEEGRIVETIAWEAGCLQKKCGACAMLINHQPALACDFFLRNVKGGKEKVITLEPLSKFPVVKDLITDRSILFENLKTLKTWSGENAQIKEKDLDRAYDASRCLQCGCCLEACPNFMPGKAFFGAAAFAPEARLISTYTKEERKELRKLYQKHIFNGCGKSLACAEVCPAGIDLERLLSRSNAVAVWNRS